MKTPHKEKKHIQDKANTHLLILNISMLAMILLPLILLFVFKEK